MSALFEYVTILKSQFQAIPVIGDFPKTHQKQRVYTCNSDNAGLQGGFRPQRQTNLTYMKSWKANWGCAGWTENGGHGQNFPAPGQQILDFNGRAKKD